jgi:hypothetical protein
MNEWKWVAFYLIFFAFFGLIRKEIVQLCVRQYAGDKSESKKKEIKQIFDFATWLVLITLSLIVIYGLVKSFL